MKIKAMHRDNWKEIIEKEYRIKAPLYGKGAVSLLKIKKVSQTVKFTYLNGEDFIIADPNYYWLTIAYENTPYWITAFFSPDHRLIQIYIDLIDSTDFSCKENPTMIDMYIDVIIEMNTYHTIDMDEFEQAYFDQQITREQYEHTLEAYRNLCTLLDKDLEGFITKVEKEFASFF